jgi:hypothetical protein
MWEGFATNTIITSRSAIITFLKGFGKSHKIFMGCWKASHSYGADTRMQISVLWIEQ